MVSSPVRVFWSGAICSRRVHVFGVFDPAATEADITTLLGAVGYPGTQGDNDAETTKSLIDVVEAIVNAGVSPIPAHVDQAKALVHVN